MYVRDEVFIGGQWVAPRGGDGPVTVYSPADELPVGHVAGVGVEDVDDAVRAASAALRSGDWPTWDAHRRGEALKRMRKALETRVSEISAVHSAESGLAISSALAMNTNALARFDAYAEFASQIDRVEERSGKGVTTRIVQDPVGVVALLTPWNGPFATTITKVGAALMAGCTVVVKSPPETPLSPYFLAEAAAEAGIPPGVVNVLHGGREVGGALVEHPDVSAISLTGSVPTGIGVMAAAARGLKRVTLELGGKSAAILLPDVDLDQAIPPVVRSSMTNTGQVCVAWTRVLAPRSMYDDVVDRMAREMRAIELRDPSDESCRFGPLTTAAQRDIVEKYVRIAVEEGAVVVTGGRRPTDRPRGYWYEPTLLRDVSNQMTISQEEVFGPVVVVIPYDEVDDAVRIANDSEFGLSAGVWTSDAEAGWSVARRLETGIVNVNCLVLADYAPFGGRKRSGIGREYGLEGIAEFLESKSISLPG